MEGLRLLSRQLKLLLSSFLIVLTIGFLSGTRYLFYNSTTNPTGIEEHYNGNEFSDDQEVMKFKKSEKEMTVSDLVCLKNVSLKVKKGEFVCIIGDVGAGKSSLLSSILGEL